jgi:molecular chaperone GrpE
MNFNKETENQDKSINEDVEASSKSIEEFIRQLELKEKDLHISPEMSIEIDESDFDDTNPPDFIRSEFGIKSDKKDVSKANLSSNNLTFSEVVEENSHLKSENFRLKDKIDKIGKEHSEMKSVMHRRQVDFDNYKKRIERNHSETFTNQIGNLATLILPVLDNMNRALDFAEEHSEGKSNDFQEFYRGIVLVNQQLNEVLAEMGILPIRTIGEQFNPHFHEAVATEETGELPANMITQELLRGYRIGDKVIRAAMVKVSTAPRTEKVVSVSENDSDEADFSLEVE